MSSHQHDLGLLERRKKDQLSGHHAQLEGRSTHLQRRQHQHQASRLAVALLSLKLEDNFFKAPMRCGIEYFIIEFPQDYSQIGGIAFRSRIAATASISNKYFGFA